jgi:hypothetical protein
MASKIILGGVTPEGRRLLYRNRKLNRENVESYQLIEERGD